MVEDLDHVLHHSCRMMIFEDLSPPVINSSLPGEIQQTENQVNQTMFLNLIEIIKETVNDPISSLQNGSH